jgi:hypothetical protein
MKLVKARVNMFWNFIDSKEVEIEDDVTCLVGKNESGKTAFLKALYQLNPAYENGEKIHTTNDYPRWKLARDRRDKNIEETCFSEGIFNFEENDYQLINQFISDNFQIDLPRETQISISRLYNGNLKISLIYPESAIVNQLAIRIPELSDFSEKYTGISFERFIEIIDEEITNSPVEKKKNKILKELRDLVIKFDFEIGSKLPDELVTIIGGLIPKFFYFSNYSILEGRMDIDKLSKQDKGTLSESERTAYSLLKLANIKFSDILNTNFEQRVSELEAAANLITQEIFTYWTTNVDLSVTLVPDPKEINTPNGPSIVQRFIDIRLNDLRHQVTTNFSRRSAGFQWFFSFIAAFSEFEAEKRNIIVLLDEPGLNLHARAQNDFLKFINERLAVNCQVIYTTHSPFMIEPEQINRVRLVEDLTTRLDPDKGAKISTDVLSVNSDTLFPLQAALGYDIAQNLFVGNNNLIVEGISDYLYLLLFSERLNELDREHLNSKWVIIPVGGIDKIPTFIALLGAHLGITVLIDASITQYQKLIDLVSKGNIKKNRIIALDSITNISRSNIEDLFKPEEYLYIYNQAFNEIIDIKDLRGEDSIIEKISRLRKSEFSHLLPSNYLLRNKEECFTNNISEDTLKRFEELFNKINHTLHS